MIPDMYASAFVRACTAKRSEYIARKVMESLAEFDLRDPSKEQEVRRVLKSLEEEEHYEACAGIRDALARAKSKT